MNSRTTKLIIRTIAGFGLLLAVLIAAGVLVERYWPQGHWRKPLEALERQYGVSIRFDEIGSTAWLRAQKARYRKALRFERAGLLEKLALDLSRYSPGFIKAHLREIVVLRSLELNGASYGGTYQAAEKKLFILGGWLGDDGSSPEAMGFHHELSSLLMHEYPDIFRAKDWKRLNPEGFRYQFAASSGANLHTDKLDLVGNAETWKRGFLCAYGELSLEDDINTFAQYLAAGKKRWPQIAQRYPQLAAKMTLLKSWYTAIGYYGTPQVQSQVLPLMIVPGTPL